MAQRPDDAERKRLKAEYKKAEREEARSHMVLDADQLDDLLTYVEAEVEIAGCDHSLRATRAWAVANEIDPEVLAKSLEHFGGYCDCEVVLNVGPVLPIYFAIWAVCFAPDIAAHATLSPAVQKGVAICLPSSAPSGVPSAKQAS